MPLPVKPLPVKNALALTQSALALTALAVLVLAAQPAAQDLTGQSVDVSRLGFDAGTQTVTPGGVTFNDFTQFSITVTPTQVVFTNVSGGPNEDGSWLSSFQQVECLGLLSIYQPARGRGTHTATAYSPSSRKL